MCSFWIIIINNLVIENCNSKLIYGLSSKNFKMKNLFTLLFIFLCWSNFGQFNANQDYHFKQDFGQILEDLSTNYIYLKDKKTDFSCVKEKYSKVINMVKTDKQRILFFEYLLDEFYDSNLKLNTETKHSYRFHLPIYVTLKDDKFYVKDIWYSQMKDYGKNIVGAEVLRFNSKEFNNAIDNYPTQCVNKNLPEVREWIANRIISGRNNKARILTLQTLNNKRVTLNIDNIKITENRELLSVYKKNRIAVVKINNSLGNDNLLLAFDKKLESLMDTDGLILDLRNTVDGGKPYNVRGIMSRFVNAEMPYQKFVTEEKLGNNPVIIRKRLESVTPRGKQYKKPVVVLVGRWTNNTAESLAIGFDGLQRAKVIGTEMGKFSGTTLSYSFNNRNYGYRIPTEKLYQLNGTLREKFIPQYNVTQENTLSDGVLEKAFSVLKFDIDQNFNVNGKEKNSIVKN